SDWSLELNPQTLLRTGFEASDQTSAYDYQLLRDSYVVQNGVLTIARRSAAIRLRPSGERFGAFLTTRFQAPGTLILEPGLRFDHDSATGDDQVSPRLAAALPLSERTTLRASWGNYTQSQGLHELSVPDGETRLNRAEVAEHRIIGLEHRLTTSLSLRLEAYERLTTHVRPRWDNTANLYNIFPEVQSDRTYLAPASARARGLEVLLDRRALRGFGWTASYALARAEETLNGRAVPAARDQRNTLRLEASYAWNTHWNFSASWHYHSGWPTTDVSYILIPLNNGKRYAQRVVGPAYAAQLPDYHRLDLRATRRWEFGRSNLTAFIDLFNAYNRTNLVGYSYSPVVSGNTVNTTREARDLLPLMPSVGVTWEF
ncbi:MAG: TonB-dependent receptor, partial [Opitutaceae bacterium]